MTGIIKAPSLSSARRRSSASGPPPLPGGPPMTRVVRAPSLPGDTPRDAALEAAVAHSDSDPHP